jgi:predicted RecA/RadA family phage recombinase
MIKRYPSHDHKPVTVVDTSSVDLTIVGQQLSASAIFGTTAGTVAEGNDSRLVDKKTQAIRDGKRTYNDEPDVLDIKIRAGDGVVKSISDPIQFLVPAGVANLEALRELV